ncbi:RNA methyltransferase [Spirochaetia bacterium]|nr:RNA methyltransferase [Spirochaetia bacterium]
MYNRLKDELAVCGLNAVKAVADVHPQTINRLFMREEHLDSFRTLCKDMAERKRPYKLCDDEELERICKSVHHQGIVAMIEEPEAPPLTRDDLDLWAAEGKTGIVLHSVGNDHNLGAIIRSAAFFDVHFVVISELDKYAKLTTSAYRVAEGGMEYVNIRSVHRSESFLSDAAKQLLVVGADPRARRRIGNIGSVIEEHPSVIAGKGRPGIALVVGNEESGLPEAVKSKCTALLRINGTGNIESLNVAQAASLFLYAIYNA